MNREEEAHTRAQRVAAERLWLALRGAFAVGFVVGVLVGLWIGTDGACSGGLIAGGGR